MNKRIIWLAACICCSHFSFGQKKEYKPPVIAAPSSATFETPNNTNVPDIVYPERGVDYRSIVRMDDTAKRDALLTANGIYGITDNYLERQLAAYADTCQKTGNPFFSVRHYNRAPDRMLFPNTTDYKETVIAVLYTFNKDKYLKDFPEADEATVFFPCDFLITIDAARKITTGSTPFRMNEEIREKQVFLLPYR